MNLEELIREVGGNVFLKKAKVEFIDKIPGLNNVRVQIRILDPSTVPVNRVDTWLVKVDDHGEVVCVLQPHNFIIVLDPEFVLRRAMFFPNIEIKSAKQYIDAILDRVSVGDTLDVLHIMPANNPGIYCSFSLDLSRADDRLEEEIRVIVRGAKTPKEVLAKFEGITILPAPGKVYHVQGAGDGFDILFLIGNGDRPRTIHCVEEGFDDAG